MRTTQTENPVEGEPVNPINQGENIIWSSQTEHYHVTPHGIRLLDYQEDERDLVVDHYEKGTFEPESVQVSVRNRQGTPIRARQKWDGHQLHIDVHTTRKPQAPLLEALRQALRYYSNRYDAQAVLAALITLLFILAAISATLLTLF